MLSQVEISQLGRQQEHFFIQSKLLVFSPVSTTPHGWERLAGRRMPTAKSLAYTRGEDRTEDTCQVPFTEEELAVLKKILTLGCVTAHGNG